MKAQLILLILLTSTCLYGQTFHLSGEDPFNLQSNIVVSEGDTVFKITLQIDFVDLDGDEDLDILYTGPIFDTLLKPVDGKAMFIEMQENTGSKIHPEFGERIPAFDSLEYPAETTVMFIDAGDLNGDGLMDLVCSAEIDTNDYQSYLLFYFQNADHSFTKMRCTDFELDEFIRNSALIPELTDLDLDGDLDLMMSGSLPDFDDPEVEVPVTLYAKNTGSITDPEFLGWFYMPYGLDPNPTSMFIRTGDLDLDGDLDALGLDINGGYQFKYAQNDAGADGRPAFNGFSTESLGIPPPAEGDIYLVPELCDLDTDGDLDVLIPFMSEPKMTCIYYENTDCDPVQYPINETICEGESFMVGEEEFTQSGTYTISTTLSSGCIEHTVLTLEVLPAANTYIEAEICEGDQYYFGGEDLTLPGEYAQSFPTSTGCDSTVYLTLTVHPTEETDLNEIICKNEVIYVGEEAFSQSGEYEIELVSSEGCDSTVLLNLEVIEIDTTVQFSNDVLYAVQLEGLAYQWFDCNTNQDISGATQHEFEVPYSGSFGVAIEDITSGCKEVSGCHYVIPTGTSITNEPSIRVIPNPTTGTVSIINHSDIEIDRVNLIDLSGNCIEEFQKAGIREIDIGNHKNGLYYLKIHRKDKVFISEIVLMK